MVVGILTNTVLLPAVRRAKSGLFGAAVQSVLNQEFKTWERME